MDRASPPWASTGQPDGLVRRNARPLLAVQPPRAPRRLVRVPAPSDRRPQPARCHEQLAPCCTLIRGPPRRLDPWCTERRSARRALRGPTATPTSKAVAAAIPKWFFGTLDRDPPETGRVYLEKLGNAPCAGLRRGPRNRRGQPRGSPCVSDFLTAPSHSWSAARAPGTRRPQDMDMSPDGHVRGLEPAASAGSGRPPDICTVRPRREITLPVTTSDLTKKHVA